jgi:hypothetical protein
MRATLLAALAISLVACLGQLEPSNGGGGSGGGSGTPVPPPPGGGGGSGSGSAEDTARIYFNENVYGMSVATCGASQCHNAQSPGANAPAWVSQTTPQSDGSAAWSLVTGMPSLVGTFTPSAGILTVPANGHFATWSATQITSITTWLQLEAQWRSAGSGSGTTATDYMGQWSGCMQLTDFQTAGVATAFANQVNTQEGVCEVCHVNGQAQSYFMANPDSTDMFNALTTYREYLSTYFTVNTTTKQVVVNTVPFQLAAKGGVDGQHPNNWNPTTNKAMTALQSFYTATAAHMTAGGCAPSTLKD